jgi:hypothetical protein
MHIGLIGGIGPAATEFYYRGLTDRHAKSGTRLDLTIANAEVRDLSENLTNKDARKQAGIFAALIARLKAAGAQAAAVTSMGGHFCVGELIPISPLPILNGIPEVDAAVTRRRFKTIAASDGWDSRRLLKLAATGGRSQGYWPSLRSDDPSSARSLESACTPRLSGRETT